MSCGKTPTRRQVHGHKRIVIVRHVGTPIGRHKVTKPPVGRGGTGAGGPARLPRPKQKVTTTPRKNAHGKMSPAALRALRAWEKKHPFKNDFAAWAKAHPFKNKRFTRAQFLAWEKKHPFKSGGHTRQQGLQHKVACHIKTRHAVHTSRGPKRREKPKGKRIVITRPLPATAVKAARSPRAQKAQRSARAR